MANNGHSAECNAQVEAVTKARAEYKQRWPDHCTACEGWGGKGYTEMHGFKHGSGEQMFELCPACIGNDEPCITCPRCAGSIPLALVEQMSQENSPCSLCGWNWGKDPGDALPDFDPCVDFYPTEVLHAD